MAGLLVCRAFWFVGPFDLSGLSVCRGISICRVFRFGGPFGLAGLLVLWALAVRRILAIRRVFRVCRVFGGCLHAGHCRWDGCWGVRGPLGALLLTAVLKLAGSVRAFVGEGLLWRGLRACVPVWVCVFCVCVCLRPSTFFRLLFFIRFPRGVLHYSTHFVCMLSCATYLREGPRDVYLSLFGCLAWPGSLARTDGRARGERGKKSLYGYHD